MKTTVKALIVIGCMLMAAGTASAHGRGRVYAQVRPYYPVVVQLQPHYLPAPGYYQDHDGYVAPTYHARRDWRREQWRREQWRRDHWRHHGCRRHHHHHH